MWLTGKCQSTGEEWWQIPPIPSGNCIIRKIPTSRPTAAPLWTATAMHGAVDRHIFWEPILMIQRMNKVSCFNSYVIVNTFSFSPQPRHLTVAILLGFFYTVYSMVQTFVNIILTWSAVIEDFFCYIKIWAGISVYRPIGKYIHWIMSRRLLICRYLDDNFRIMQPIIYQKEELYDY